MRKLLFVAEIHCLLLLLFCHVTWANVPGYPASSYYVDPGGNDSNPGTNGLPFKTVQRAADLAVAGQVIEVRPGTYLEQVLTKRDGSSGKNIVFVSTVMGAAQVSSFEIRHAYTVVDGFSLDGQIPAVSGFQGIIAVRAAGNFCQILNNTIHDWKSSVYGILLDSSGTNSSTDCLIKNNLLKNAGFNMISMTGKRVRVENNNFDTSNGWDALRVFGSDNKFRNNFFKAINAVVGNGNHVDIIQGFDDIGSESHDILFEGNFIVDSDCQMGQINNDRYSDLVYNWTFRQNVFARMNTAYNMSASVRGVHVLNNTVVSTGLFGTGQISDNSFFTSNAFVGNASGSAGIGWYTTPRGVVYPGLFGKWVSGFVDCTGLGAQECIDKRNNFTKVNMLDGLMAKGFLGTPNGNNEYLVLPAAAALADPAALGLSYPFNTFADIVLKTITQVIHAQQTFRAQNNFVSGPAPTFAAKDSNCTTPYRAFNFCESGGINGGDPQFQDINDPLGPDKLPFTADDGLRPRANSRLCIGGENGGYIGAYPCNGTLQQAGMFSSRIPVDNSVTPRPPSQLRVM